MEQGTKPIWAVVKAIVFVIFLPLALIWYVWNRTAWKKQNKWIATAVIAVVFLFIFTVGRDGQPKTETESAAKIASLEKELEAEKKKNATPPVAEKVAAVPVEETATVERAVDGDTLKLSDGRVVRLIGIDAPETVDPEKPVQCFGKEASAEAKKLLTGHAVKLVKDVSQVDKYDRLLRYVYLGDTFVNDFLVRQGFARADNFPPDEKFKTQLKQAQDEAKSEKRGLWAQCL